MDDGRTNPEPQIYGVRIFQLGFRIQCIVQLKRRFDRLGWAFLFLFELIVASGGSTFAFLLDLQLRKLVAINGSRIPFSPEDIPPYPGSS
jgi:hypothetical protein